MPPLSDVPRSPPPASRTGSRAGRDVLLAPRLPPARLWGTPDPTGPLLVWLHGGSWAFGSVEGWSDTLSMLSLDVGLPVVAPRYPTSLEQPFPAQLEQVGEALEVLRGLTSGPVLVGGDSAGATLVAHLAARAPHLMDRQLLAYPPFEPACADAGFDDPAVFPSRERMLWAWRTYAGLGAGPDARPEDGPDEAAHALRACTPLHATQPCPPVPASLLVGEGDPVRGEVERYTARLRAAGGAVRLSVREHLEHGDFLRGAPHDPRLVHHWVADETARHLRGDRP